MSLQDIKGQGHAVSFLKKGIERERLAHAYLFVGPRGVGKRKTAFEFAKLLNCQEAKGDCCDRCPSCINIKNLRHPDISFISKEEDESQISIDRIRALRNRLYLKPFEARWKVAIIADTDEMTEQASNCLLKILEEPPPDTMFILTTSNARDIPQTIVSRCQIVRFKPLTRDEVNNILMKEFLIEEKEARFLSAISDANITKALRLKEREALVWKNEVIDDFRGDRYMPSDEPASVLNDKRQIQVEALDILMGFCRDILVYKYTKSPDLLINIDREGDIGELAQRMDAKQLRLYMKEIENIRSSFDSNANARLALRVLKEKVIF